MLCQSILLNFSCKNVKLHEGQNLNARDSTVNNGISKIFFSRKVGVATIYQRRLCCSCKETSQLRKKLNFYQCELICDGVCYTHL